MLFVKKFGTCTLSSPLWEDAFRKYLKYDTKILRISFEPSGRSMQFRVKYLNLLPKVRFLEYMAKW